jgi:hypothetical protein
MADPWDTRTALELLALINTLDPRFRLGADDDTRARAEVYAKVLTTGGVEPRWAGGFVTRYYTVEREWPLQIGAIVQAWKGEQRVQEARERDPMEALREHRNAPPWFRQYALDCQAAADATGSTDPLTRRQAIEAVPRPPVRDTGLAGTRARDCGVEQCPCSHTRCRGGWLDEQTEVESHGIIYTLAVRCRACTDAVLMREERAENRRASRPRRGAH